MKAIIIAAGAGKRIGDLTSDKPKCLLPIAGKPLLRHQLDTLSACGINDVAVVVGHQRDKITFPGLTYYNNDRYIHNNILHSFMYAEPAMNGPFIGSYSDILFGHAVVSRLLNAEGDIVIVVDTDWKCAYEGRTDHPYAEAEKVIVDSSGRLLSIGKKVVDPLSATGEFIGMMKCTARGAQLFKTYFQQARELFDGTAFYEASTFERAYLTDFFQYLTDKGVVVRCALIRGGWYEIDTLQDYQRVSALFGKQSLVSSVSL